MSMWHRRIWILSVFVALLLTGGCSNMHAGLSAGHHYPVQSDLSGGTMYGLDFHVKVNDKWRAGVELHQLVNLGGSEYSFTKTYSGPSLGTGTPVPATSTISMTSILYGVQYFLKDYLLVDAAFGEMRAQVNEASSSYSYATPAGDKIPSGSLFKMSLLYTTKKSIADIFPYVGVSYLHLDTSGALHKADGTRVTFSDTDSIGLMFGILM